MSRKSKLKKIGVIFGTRPEAIKMASVVRELKRRPDVFQPLVCVTAQHREMLDEVLKLFSIKAHYDLDIMENNQSPFEVTARGLISIKKVLESERPDAILVQGDTTTTFTASLAAYYLKIPIGHIEAGLRTNDKYSPFPEEMNRRLTSHLADFHFVPTQRAMRHLILEGISKSKVFFTGNTIIDALFHILKKNKNNKAFERKYLFLNNLGSDKLIMVTAHRRENFGAPLGNICRALKQIVRRNRNVIVVYPVHPNPNVNVAVKKILGKVKRINLIAPLDYSAFVYLMSKSYIILTDSGGVQEEASSLGKPVLVMRENTERQEVLEAGVAKLVGADIDKIISNTETLLKNKRVYDSMARITSPFGDGRAAQRIVEIIKDGLL